MHVSVLKENADMKVEPSSVGGSQNFRLCYSMLSPGYVQGTLTVCIYILYAPNQPLSSRQVEFLGMQLDFVSGNGSASSEWVISVCLV